MIRFIKVGEAAKILGVSIQTLRRWEETGYLLPDRKSPGQTMYYNLDKLVNKNILDNDLTICYARVSSHDQKDDLKRQADVLTEYRAKQGWNFSGPS